MFYTHIDKRGKYHAKGDLARRPKAAKQGWWRTRDLKRKMIGLYLDGLLVEAWPIKHDRDLARADAALRAIIQARA